MVIFEPRPSTCVDSEGGHLGVQGGTVSTVFTAADTWASIEPMPLVTCTGGRTHACQVSRLREYARPAVDVRPLILYLERDPRALNIRKVVLGREGYRVIGVSRREDALQMLRDSPVSLTITDHLFSRNSSSEIAGEMKKIKPDVSILLFSRTVPQHFDGVDVYINQGEPTAEFLRIVRNVIE